MIRTWLTIASVLALPVLAQAQTAGQPNEPGGMQPGQQGAQQPGMQQGQPGQQGAPQAISIPPGAKLLGSTRATEIREFPEVQSQKKNKNPVAGLVGVSSVDNVYQIDRSFNDMVKFFDQQFKKGGTQVVERTITPTATAWMVRLPAGNLANVIVRNTQPVTFELVQVAAAVGEIQQPTNP
jgi:hypothetical protein